MTKQQQTVRAFKGFDRSFSCRGFKYEVGKTYRHEGEVRACSGSFHACTSAIDVFDYYAPGTSRFAEVALGGEMVDGSHDSKIAAAEITIVRELTICEMISNAVASALADAKPEKGALATGLKGVASATGLRGAASATGYYGAASATGLRGAASATGYYGVASATGKMGTASATGYRGAASATGDSGAASATGKHGAACGLGFACRAFAAEGCALILLERADDGTILHAFAGIAGRDGVKPDTWYRLAGGKLVEIGT